jgi:hypothetical protein
MNTHRLPPGWNCVEPAPSLTNCRGYRTDTHSYAIMSSSYPNPIGAPPFDPIIVGNQYGNSNYYIETNQTRSVGKCDYVRGWAGVLSSVVWHGRYGFSTLDYCPNRYVRDTSGFPYGWTCAIEPIHDTVPDPKYLSITVEGAIQWYDAENLAEVGEPASASWSSSFYATVTVSPSSGQVTTYSNVTYSTGSAGTGSQGETSGSVFTILQGKMDALLQSTCISQYASGQGDQCNINNNVWNWSGAWLPCCGLCGYWFGGGATSWTDSSATTSQTVWLTVKSGFAFNCSITFSDPYSSADVCSATDSLTSLWRLDYLRDFEFRTDTNFSLLPLVRHDSSRYATNPDTAMLSLINNPGQTYVDPNAGYSGAVIGYRLPDYSGSYDQYDNWIYGKDAYFNPYYQEKHENWTYDDYLQTWVIGSTGSWVPSSLCGATEWTPNYLMDPNTNINVKGGFRWFKVPGGISDDCLYTKKYVEVLLATRPSYNWSRPFLERDGTVRDPFTSDCSAGSGSDISYTGSHFDAYCSGSGGFANPCGNIRWPSLASYSASASGSFYNDDQKKIEYSFTNWTWDRHWSEYTRFNSAYPTNLSSQCALAYATAGLYPHTKDREGSKNLSTILATTDNLKWTPCKINLIAIHGVGDYLIDGNFPYVQKNVSAIHFMPNIVLDSRYGSRLMSDCNQWMTDLLWDPPASICVLSASSPCEGTVLQYWVEDTGEIYTEYNIPVAGGPGLCAADTVTGANRCYKFYPMRPWVEARTGPPTDVCTGYIATTPPSGSRANNDCSGYVSLWNNSVYTSSNPRSYPYEFCELCNTPIGVNSLGYGYGLTWPMNNVIPWVIQQQQETCVTESGRFAEIYAANGGGFSTPTILL